MTPISVGAAGLRIDSSNSLNTRVHHHVRAKKNKVIADVVRLVLLGKTAEAKAYLQAGGRCEVTLVRVAPRLMDSDNNTSALKAVRDAIAQLLGVDDGDARWVWQTRQRKGSKNEWCVYIEIAPIPSDPVQRAVWTLQKARAEQEASGLSRADWLNALRSHMEAEIEALKMANGTHWIQRSKELLHEMGLPVPSPSSRGTP